MAAIKVKFELKKSKDSQERITLSRGDWNRTLTFGDDGTIEVDLEDGAIYFVRWYYLGKIDDEMSATWSVGTDSHTFIASFKLNKKRARLGPDGKWVDAGTTGFMPYVGA